MAKRICVLVLLLAAICYLDSVDAAHTAGTGYLFSISSSFVFNAFQVDVSSERVVSLYRTPVQLGGDQVTLRDPCPSCHPSYNLFEFNVNQTIIPNANELYIITVFTMFGSTPYFQIVSSPDCIPVNIFKPSRFYGVLYILCQNARLSVNYFLARLTRESTDLQWSYEALPNFDDFTSEGTFSEYYDPDFDIYFVYYVYERNDLLVFEGPDNNYIRFFALPEDCTKVIRITAIPNDRYHVLVECGNQTDSDNITSVHVFDSDSGSFARVLQNVSYSKCPIQFADSGRTLVIFAEMKIIIKHLIENTLVEVDIAGPIYDGQLTEIDGEIFAVYSTLNGLFRINITTNQEMPQSNFEESETVCAHAGCPLLQLLTPNNLIVLLGNNKTALYSITPPNLLNSVSTDLQPARFLFEERSPLPTPSVSNQPLPTSSIRNLFPSSIIITEHTSVLQADMTPMIMLQTTSVGKVKESSLVSPTPLKVDKKFIVPPEAIILIVVVIISIFIGLVAALLIGVVCHNHCKKGPKQKNNSIAEAKILDSLASSDDYGQNGSLSEIQVPGAQSNSDAERQPQYMHTDSTTV